MLSLTANSAHFTFFLKFFSPHYPFDATLVLWQHESRIRGDYTVLCNQKKYIFFHFRFVVSLYIGQFHIKGAFRKVETLHNFLENTARYLYETFFILARVVWENNISNFIKFCQLFLHESVVFMLFSTHFAVSSRNCLHRRVFLFQVCI